MLSSTYGYHISSFEAKLCGQHINKSWLKELEDSFWGTLSATKRPQIVMHFIQKLQGGNSNETY